MSFSMRACTERIACSSVVHSSNSVVSASTRLSIRRTFELFLPRRPRSSSVCSASWRRGVADVAADVVLDPLRAFLDDLLEHLAPLRQELRAERGLEQRQAALVQRHRVAADARGERLPRREREDALDRHAERARGLALLLRDLRLDLLERRERIFERVDLVEDDEARRRVRAEVVAPDRQVGLGDAGVGAEDEDGRVRARQEAQRQLGLGADRVQARRVEDDEALLQERVRVVDEGVAPGRHLDLAGVVARRVVVGRRVVPEAERARLLLADPLGARDLEQRLRRAGRRRATSSARRRQARGWARISPSERPSRRVSIGSSSSEAGSSPRQPSSTGHIVVRPGVAGRMRRPVSAKKIALMSSDLPRENSATKATTSFSLPSRSRKAVTCSAASP